jgi:hypothetical protein
MGLPPDSEQYSNTSTATAAVAKIGDHTVFADDDVAPNAF